MNQPSAAIGWGAYKPRARVHTWIALHNLPFLGRPIKRWIRRQVASHSNVFDVRVAELKFRSYIKDNTTERNIVFDSENSNLKDVELAISCLPAGGTFLDIGANCGLFTLAAAARVGASGRVIAIEANPIMIDRLNFNIAANDFDNVTVVPVAVGDHEGSAELQIVKNQMGKSTFVSRVTNTTISVRVQKLSDILKSASVTSIEAMKIDVEGFEDRAIIPMLAEVPREVWPKRVMLETVHASFWQSDCVHHLLEAGYRVVWKGKSDSILELE
jgi:FkbM family methyltransferase